MNDGGPVYHVIGNTTYKGMTLRDYFAAAALQGLLSNPKSFEVVAEKKLSKQQAADNYADYAYTAADAMLLARDSKEPAKP